MRSKIVVKKFFRKSFFEQNIKESAKINSRAITSLIIALCSLIQTTAFAEEIVIAAIAANFSEPFKEISYLFSRKTKTKIDMVFSSSGKLYAQLVEGAPYNIFLSADEKMPEDLYRKGISEKPFIYANGEIVLWSSNKYLCGTGDWKTVLKMKKIRKIAIANAEVAPYGAASMIALKNTGNWGIAQDKLIFAQDISQAFQYAATQSVDAAFCAKSSALSEHGKAGCFLMIKEAPRVIQSACIIRNGKTYPAAAEFARFLVSPEAEGIKKKYGYR